jgi:hypothetical protein
MPAILENFWRPELTLSEPIESQFFFRQTQVLLKYRNDELMVIALRQPGNGNRANATSSRDKNRETSAMRSIVREFKPIGAVQTRLRPLMLQPDSVGASVIPHHDVALTAHPFPVVRRGAAHRVGEKRMAVQLNINRHGNFAFFGGRLDRASDGPRDFRIEMFELQPPLLQRNFFQILIPCLRLFRLVLVESCQETIRILLQHEIRRRNSQLRWLPAANADLLLFP